MHTTARHDHGAEPTDLTTWRVRVTGDDPTEVVRAAQLAGESVSVTGRGRYWFATTLAALPAIRDELPLSVGDFFAWCWLLRPRDEYFQEGFDRASDDVSEMGAVGSRVAGEGTQPPAGE